jgi:hypothetical protein
LLLIATTGRCATRGLALGLTRFSDTTVDHEPRPQLLREAFLKHVGVDHRTELFQSRLAWLREREEARYGQTIRAAPLLDDLAEALPTARFVLLVREPYSYVRSAMSRRVLLRGDEWDLYRVLPLDLDLTGLSRPEVIALHWREVNRYLLDFAARHRHRSRLMILGDLRRQIVEIAEFGGASVTDPAGLDDFLARRPNQAPLRDALQGARDGDLSLLLQLVRKRIGRDGAGTPPGGDASETVRRAVEETWRGVQSAAA